MAKSQLFERPMQWIYTHGGVFPVRRGYARRGGVHHRDAASSSATARSRCTARAGARAPASCRRRCGRASAGSRCSPARTIVPVAIHGSSQVRNWKRLQFPKVTVLYGDPIRWERVEEPTREQQQAVANEIFAEVRKLYAQLDAVGRRGVVRRSGASCAGRDGGPAPGRPRRASAWPVAGAGRSVRAARGSAPTLGAPTARPTCSCRRRGAFAAAPGRRCGALDGAWDAIQPAVEAAGRRRPDPPARAAARRRARGGGAGRAGEPRADAVDRVGAAGDPAGGDPARGGDAGGEVAELAAFLASPAGAYYSGCRFDLR